MCSEQHKTKSHMGRYEMCNRCFICTWGSICDGEYWWFHNLESLRESHEGCLRQITNPGLIKVGQSLQRVCGIILMGWASGGSKMTANLFLLPGCGGNVPICLWLLPPCQWWMILCPQPVPAQPLPPFSCFLSDIFPQKLEKQITSYPKACSHF